MADKQSREEVVNKAKEIGKQSEESGKRVGDALKELTVKISVDVDVSDAITGLKAVQREAKEATKALRGIEAQSGDGIRVTLDSDGIIADSITSSRMLFGSGADQTFKIIEGARATINMGDDVSEVIEGPAEINVRYGRRFRRID